MFNIARKILEGSSSAKNRPQAKIDNVTFKNSNIFIEEII